MTTEEQKVLDPRAQWHGRKEHGSTAVLRLAVSLYRMGGETIEALLLRPIVCYFFLKDSAARRYSRLYLSRVESERRRTGRPFQPKVFQHFLSFGKRIVHGLAAWSGKWNGEDVLWTGREDVIQCIESGTGGLVLSAHMGCLDVCRATHSQLPNLKVTPLMFHSEKQNYEQFIRAFPRAQIGDVLPIESFHLGVAIEVERRVRGGEFVAVLADRLFPGTSAERSIPVTFLGTRVNFPEGPFLLARTLGCPVFTFFTVYDDEQKKHRGIWQQLNIPRGDRGNRESIVMSVAEEYARRLEELTLQYPYQWFNFYDYFGDSAATSIP